MDFSILPLVLVAMGWLAVDAHRHRVAGRTFGPGYRALLWAAAAACGLIALVAGILTVLVLRESPGNIGFAGVLLLFTPLITLGALAGALAFVWYARYRPQPGVPAGQRDPGSPPSR